MVSKPEGTGWITDLTAVVPAAVLAEVRRGATLARLLALDGVRLRRGAGGVAEANCPFPAHALRSDSFRIDPANPRHFWCTECGVKGGVAEYLRARFGGTTTSVGGGQGDGVGLAPLLRKVEREVSGWRAPAVDRVFEALLNKLTLYAEHAEFLLARGISSRRLLGRQFRSLPVERGERVRLCEELASAGYDLESVPGLFRLPYKIADTSARGRWCFAGNHLGRRETGGLGKESPTRFEVGGILTPVRDWSQRIQALEVSNDEAPAQAPESLRQRWPPRTELLGYEQGSESRGGDRGEIPLHFALPESRREPALVVTEGALRAEVLAAVYGAVVVGVADLERQIEQVLEAMREFVRTIACFAPGQGSETNLLLNAAKKQSLNVGIVDWERLGGCSYNECVFR